MIIRVAAEQRAPATAVDTHSAALMRTPSTSSMISGRAPVHFPGILSLCQLPYFWPHVRLPLLATTRLFYHALPCTCTYPYLQGWPKRITNTRLCTWWPHQQYSMIAHLQYTCEHLRYSIILNIPRINLDEVQRNLIRFRGQVVPIGVLLTAHYVCKVDQNALPTRASELDDQQYSMGTHLQYTCEHLRYSILNIPRINLDEVQRNLIRFRGQVVPIAVLLTAHFVCHNYSLVEQLASSSLAAHL